MPNPFKFYYHVRCESCGWENDFISGVLKCPECGEYELVFYDHCDTATKEDLNDAMYGKDKKERE